MISQFKTTIMQSEAGGVAQGSVIWMHGLGAYARDFFNLESRLGLPADLSLRFIFPQANDQSIAVNGNLMMPAWYNILSLHISENEDREGIIASQNALNALIDQEIAKGIPSERIFLGGFSQGGAMALFTGLRYPHKLGGIIGLSTYLPMLGSVEYQMSKANAKIPIFMAHGEYDDVLPMALAMRTYNALYEISVPIEWHVYEMKHQVRLEELVDVGAFIAKIMLS